MKIHLDNLMKNVNLDRKFNLIRVLRVHMVNFVANFSTVMHSY